MDEHSSTKNPKRRRRALTWGIFGLAGVIMSTAWATGFDTSESTATGTNEAANAVGLSADEPQTASRYVNLINATPANVSPLAITFDGLWGQVAAEAKVFEVDLTGVDAGTFYVDIYVDNLPFERSWSAAQIKWHQSTGVCADADFESVDEAAGSDLAGEPKVMNITETDAHVSFPGLASGATYCFGIASTDLTSELTDDSNGVDLHADDQDGTFLTRPDTGVEPTAPAFTAIVNRSA